MLVVYVYKTQACCWLCKIRDVAHSCKSLTGLILICQTVCTRCPRAHTHILQLQWINQHCIRALYRINRHRFRRRSGTVASFHTKVRTDNCQKLKQLLLLLLHPFNGLFSRTTWVSRYQKGKTSLDLNEARYGEVLGCSGISWTICKQSTPRSRHNHTNTPSLNLYRPDALPDVQATV